MSDHKDYLLAKLRAASLHARLLANEIDSIGVALKDDLITDSTAIEWARDVGGPQVFGTVPPVIEHMAGTPE